MTVAQAAAALALGAQQVVDRDGDLAAEVRSIVTAGVDTAIDGAGPATWPGAMAALRDGGRFVTTSVAGLPDAERGIAGQAVAVTPDPDRLRHGGLDGTLVLDLT